MLNSSRTLIPACLLALAASAFYGQAPATVEKLHIDAQGSTTAFPHFWETTFGSGRAILSLRDNYRADLRAVKQATGFEFIRFHGILNDEVGLYDPGRVTKNPGLAAEAAHDSSAYNFFYIDQIYDGLLAIGVKPYVEMSFMPRKMAADPNQLHPFWYHPNVSPPKDYALWDDMIHALAVHLVTRYGVDEVSTWKFEVWNEPNLDFWGGSPKQATYWTLYDHTARALKAVSPRLQVGGPSTAQAAWVPAFLAHAAEQHIPVDFVSTHVYANDTAKDVLGTNEQIPRDMMVYRAVKNVHDQIAASAFPRVPLIFSEYNASYANEPDVTDSPYIGPWLANTIRLCDGLTDSMAYWDFADVFEEQGVPRTPFYGGFGLITADGIPKASFNVFSALHQLGTRRIAVDSDSALATALPHGGLAIALWDYAPPSGTGPDYTMETSSPRLARTFDLQLDHLKSHSRATLLRIDDQHGNAQAAFNAMGRPVGSLSPEQLTKLKTAGTMAPPESVEVRGGHATVTVPVHGLAVLLVQN